MTIKTIFLDRDGVINKEVNYLHKIVDFQFISGVFDACHNFQILGYKIIIVTNQAGIGKGYYSEKDYQILTQWMLNQFNQNNIKILDILHCPHLPDSKCDCRKPSPGMFLKAKNIHNVDMEKSWMIGDKEADIQAAHKSNIRNTILVRSGHKINESNSEAMFILDSIYEARKIIAS